MAIQKTTTAKNAACNAVTSLMNIGSMYPSGGLSLFSADSSVITRLGLSVPAFMDATNGVAYANQIFDATSRFDATAASFWFQNRDGSNVWGGTVGESTGDMVIGSVILPKDSTVAISSALYIVP